MAEDKKDENEDGEGNEDDKDKKKFIGPFCFPLEDVLKQSDKMEFTLKEKDTLVRFYTMSPAMNDNWLLTMARFFNSSEDGDGFFVTFTPGENAPYFELQLQESN